MATPGTSLMSDTQRLRWGRILLGWGLLGSPALLCFAQLANGRPVGAAGLVAVVLAQLGLLVATLAPAFLERMAGVMLASLVVSSAHIHGLMALHGAGRPLLGLNAAHMGVALAFLPLVFPTARHVLTYAVPVVSMGLITAFVQRGGSDASVLVASEAFSGVILLLVQATHRRTVDRVRDSERRYALAAAGTDDGLWEWDLASRRLSLSPQWKAALGYRAHELAGETPDSWLDLVHPDDKPGVLADLDQHIAGRTKKFESEHRLRARDGAWRWVLVRGLAAREDGKATWMAGWLTDLTNRRVGAVAEERSLLLERATRAGGVGMAILKAEGAFSWMSGTLYELVAAWPDAATWWRAVAEVTPVPVLPREDAAHTLRPDLLDPSGQRRVFEVRIMRMQPRVAGHALAGRLVVVREITDDVLAREELEALSEAHLRARDAALKANRAKDTFVANMSHELRTPLNAIIGYSEMLAEDAEDAGDKALVNDLHKIHSAGHQLLGLVNGILDLSRVEAGKMELLAGRFTLRPLLDEVIASVQPLLDKNGNLLDITVPRQVVEVVGDRSKLRQVAVNLVGNAAKFTDNGTVALTLEVLAGDGPGREHVRLSVADTGIGMNEEQLERLFEEFWQAESGTDRRFQGSGLGLAISRRFVEAMGGHIAVESRPGLCSRFEVTLPRVQPGLDITLGPLEVTATRDPGADDDEPSVSVSFEPPRAPTRTHREESPRVEDLSDVLPGMPGEE